MNLIPVSQWNHYHKWPTKSGFRYLIFHAKDNGLKEMGAVVKVSGRVLIDVDRFFDWVKNKNEQAWLDGSLKRR